MKRRAPEWVYYDILKLYGYFKLYTKRKEGKRLRNIQIEEAAFPMAIISTS